MTNRILIVSDIHYASSQEKLENENNLKIIQNPFFKIIAIIFRNFFWMKDPFAHNGKLLHFLAAAPDADMVIACGDYSCGTGHIGVMHPSAKASVLTCLNLFKERFGCRFLPICGDHEIGKKGLFSDKGGFRLTSWDICQEELKIRHLWHRQIGIYHLIGISSPPIILSNALKEILAEEKEQWQQLRKKYMKEIETHMCMVPSNEKIIFFCHDPTALPYLKESPIINHLLERKRITLTIVGHMHTDIILKVSRILSGMPAIHFLGNSISRMSSALHQAKVWKEFNMVLCPSLAGCQWAKDGGWLELNLEENGTFSLTRHYIKW